MTNCTIGTYGLCSCYFFLLEGYYKDGNNNISFAFLKHHSNWIDPDTLPPIEIVSSFLNEFARYLVKNLLKILKITKTFLFEKLNNLQLVVGGSKKVLIDPIKDAFSLINQTNELIDNKIASSLSSDEYLHLYNQIKNHVIILDGSTYALTNEEEELGE